MERGGESNFPFPLPWKPQNYQVEKLAQGMNEAERCQD